MDTKVLSALILSLTVLSCTGNGSRTSGNPAGPFKDALGHPLIDEVINGAQPIDQFVFRDDDGTYYMYYGGWRHCNMVRLGDDLKSLVPFKDGRILPVKITFEGVPATRL